MNSHGLLKRGALGAIAATSALLLLAAAAGADTFTPTRFGDPEPDRCRPDNCSLREAIRASNNHQGHDTIVLRRGTYELRLPPDPAGAGFDSGSFDLVDAVTIRGQGPGKTTIDGNEIDKVIQGWVQSPAVADAFELSRLTITGGDPGPGSGPSGGGVDIGTDDSLRLSRVKITRNFAFVDGGGLISHGDLTVVHSTITRNDAHGGGGIAIRPSAPEAEVTIRASRISGNLAFFGGGVYGAAGKLTIHNSTISQNTGEEGGGLDLISQEGAPPVTEIRSSTISGNTARKGGGLLVDGNQPRFGLVKPVATLTNSTVAGNSTTAEGGGIMADNAATVNLDNATIAYNRADSDGANGGVGGGVHQHSGATFGLGDSILAANVIGAGETPQQCDGAFTSADGLVREPQHAGTCTFEGDFRLVDDALIGPLADNGGPTETVKLLAGSPAIGFAHSCTKRDQRTVERPPEGCDSGAFERLRP
jgi:hypothetical protein